MLHLRRLICLLFLVLPHSVLADECEPSTDMTQQDLVLHQYVRAQPVVCEVSKDQLPNYMWKLKTGVESAWPYKHSGQCTLSKGARHKFYGCQAPEGCALFVGVSGLRIHVPRRDLTCEGGAEP